MGALDPIHQGHLVTGRQQGQNLLEKVIFVPSGQPPHKRAKDQ